MDHLVKTLETHPAAVTRDAPASAAQRRFWLLHELAGHRGALTVSLAFRLEGDLDPDRLEAAIAGVVERHEALRTAIVQRDGELRQLVLAGGRPVIARRDLRAASDARALLAANAVVDFDLERPPLLRAELARTGERAWLLLLAVHHVAVEAWSLRVLVRELASAYARGADALPPPPCQYADLAEREREWLASPQARASREYWRRALTGAPGAVPLPQGVRRPPLRRYLADSVPLGIAGELAGRLDSFAIEAGATRFMVLLAALARMLERTTGATDVVIATPAGERGDPSSEAVVGPVINTLALRLNASPAQTFEELVEQARTVTLGALEHQRLPFDEVVAELAPARSRSYTPLCQVMLITQRDVARDLDLPGVRAELLAQHDQRTSDMDLNFIVGAAGAGDGQLAYACDLYGEPEARAVARSFVAALAHGLEAPGRPAAGPAPGDGGPAVVARVAAGPGPWPLDRCVDELVAAAARRRPDAIAIEAPDESVTYAELERASSRVARGLRALGVAPGARVGVCMESGVEALVAMLGTMRAGAAYVPLDPSYPEQRLRMMAADARPACVLGGTGTRAPAGLRSDWLDVGELAGATRDGAELGPGPGADDIAYVIYTSGSTGRPKGVEVPHRALTNLVEWQRRRSGPARTLQFSSLSFDASLNEAFTTWANATTLVMLPPGDRRDLLAVARHVLDRRVERLYLPVVALQEMARIALEEGIAPASLREVCVSGERLVVTPEIRSWLAAMPGATLDNQYGATENIVATAHRLAGDPRGWPSIPPAGRPLPGVELVLVAGDRATGPGGHEAGAHDRGTGAGDRAMGELLVAGACLSRGYLDRPDATSASYVSVPGGGRAYRTGDLARLRGGVLELAGRRDDQVKVRGHRVELAEVDATLREHPRVRDAATLAVVRDQRVRHLAAAVVGPSQRGAEEVRAWLAERLPAWMVPARVHAVDSLPLTPTGKLDRRALRAALPASAGGEHVAPRDATERRLAEIWCALLGVERVGVGDDFVALGGDSLTAARLASRVQRELGREFTVTMAFDHPTIAAQARVLRSAPPATV